MINMKCGDYFLGFSRFLIVRSIVIICLIFALFVSFLFAEEKDGIQINVGDKYAVEYIQSPVFRRLGDEKNFGDDETQAIRISRISSWGVGVVEVIIRQERIMIERYYFGKDRDSELYRYLNHSVKVERGVKSDEIRKDIELNKIREALQKISDMNKEEDESIVDGSSMLAEFYLKGKWEFVYVSNGQIGTSFKEIPDSLKTGILKAVKK